MKSIQKWWIKHQLRSAYMSYRSRVDSLPCGLSIAEQLPSVAKAKARCNKLLAKMNSLDPVNFPHTSLD